MFPSAVEPRVVQSLMIKESIFCALAVCRRLVTFVSGVCEKMASLALFDQFGLSWDMKGDSFAKKEISGFENLFHFVPGVVVDHGRHSICLA